MRNNLVQSGRPAAPGGRSPPGKNESRIAGVSPQLLGHFHQLIPQPLIRYRVRLAPRPHKKIRSRGNGIQARQHVKPPDLPQPTFQLVAADDGVAVLGHDDAEPGARSGGRDEDIQMRRPLSLPPPEQPPDFAGTPNPSQGRKPRVGLSLAIPWSVCRFHGKRWCLGCAIRLRGAAGFREPADRASNLPEVRVYRQPRPLCRRPGRSHPPCRRRD